MAIAVSVTVQLGEPETGLWCYACQLPSLARWPVAGLVSTGVTPLGSITCCVECGDATQVVAQWHRRR